MTVARVVGQCNGAEIIFTRDSDGSWDVAVPAMSSGQYVVSVTAYDEAGNSAYQALMLFSVDVTTLQVQLLPLHFATSEVSGNFDSSTQLSDFVFSMYPDPFTFKIKLWHCEIDLGVWMAV